MTGEIKTLNFRLSPTDIATLEEVETYEAEEERLQVLHKIKMSEIPECYQKGFESYEVTSENQKRLLQEVKRAFDHWTKTRYTNVIFVGSNGVGKTKLSCSFLMESLKDTKEEYGITCHFSIRYKLFSDVLEEYENARSFTSEVSQAEIIKHYSEIDLLVLDEVGMNTSDKAKELLYRIVNGRANNKKTTLIISRMKIAEFLAFIGQDTADRLRINSFFPDSSGIESFRGRKNDKTP